MKYQKGYIDIPDWVFALIPIGLILMILEAGRILYWLYENVEVTFK